MTSKWFCAHYCLLLMRSDKWLWKQWKRHRCTVVPVFIPSEPWVTCWPYVWSSAVCVGVLCCVHEARSPRASYISSCLYAVCVFVCFSGSVPGMRPAEAGEFTRRAFQAGKLDLTEVCQEEHIKTHWNRSVQICISRTFLSHFTG